MSEDSETVVSVTWCDSFSTRRDKRKASETIENVVGRVINVLITDVNETCALVPPMTVKDIDILPYSLANDQDVRKEIRVLVTPKRQGTDKVLNSWKALKKEKDDLQIMLDFGLVILLTTMDTDGTVLETLRKEMMEMKKNMDDVVAEERKARNRALAGEWKEREVQSSQSSKERQASEAKIEKLEGELGMVQKELRETQKDLDKRTTELGEALHS
ncbi:hypothetical protein H0H92_001612, partial [Tricholoma furcatifolium]